MDLGLQPSDPYRGCPSLKTKKLIWAASTAVYLLRSIRFFSCYLYMTFKVSIPGDLFIKDKETHFRITELIKSKRLNDNKIKQ